MPLILHAGAEPATYEQLRAVHTPVATDTHIPVPHHELVELVRFTLGFHQHQIEDESYGLTPDGSRLFGLMTLRSPYGDYKDTLGLRNSHDRSFSIGVAFGSRTIVCDNLSFGSDHVIRRKHTAKARRELPGLLQEIIAPLQAQRLAQNEKLLTYQRTPLSDEAADHAIMSMFRQDIIGVQAIAHVHQEWQQPSHDWGDRTAFRLFNAATLALEGKVMERPDLTRSLHQVIDGTCQRLQ